MAELLSTLAQVELVGGFTVVFEAIDPTTGAAVGGVTISSIGVYADDGSETLTTSAPGADVAPSWVPIPVEPPQVAPGGGG